MKKLTSFEKNENQVGLKTGGPAHIELVLH